MPFRVVLKNWSSGDWSQLWIVDLTGDPVLIHEGHSIPDFAWSQVLTFVGVAFEEREINDPDGSKCGETL
jgi:hypothetical protein